MNILHEAKTMPRPRHWKEIQMKMKMVNNSYGTDRSTERKIKPIRGKLINSYY